MKLRTVFSVFIMLLAQIAVSQTSYQQSVQGCIKAIRQDYKVVKDFPSNFESFVGITNPVWQYRLQVKVAPYRIEMYFFEYEPGGNREAAFEYLLAHFPGDGKAIAKCHNIEGMKSPPALYLVGDNSISILQQMCEQELQITDSINEQFIQSLSFLHLYEIKVGCGGPVTWVCYR